MKVAVLSDIHGNFEAFQTCVNHALKNEVSHFLFLGDYLGEFGFPQKTMELLYQLNKDHPCTFIKGNKEDYWLHQSQNADQKWKENDSTTGSVQRTIQHKDKKVINPGAVGVPLKSGGKTQFIILHGKESGWQEEFVDLCYDVEKEIDSLYSARLHQIAPFWCKTTEQLLRTGIHPHSFIMGIAMHYCKEDRGECNWPEIPEKYWEKAFSDVFGENYA